MVCISKLREQEEQKEIVPISVNWHLWPYCNYKCSFCFATFDDLPHPSYLTLKQGLEVVKLLAKAGTQKLTFAGGEPTLCPFLGELLKEAKKLGLTIMVVSNGSGFTDDFLLKYGSALDWAAISIDSPNEQTQFQMGRGNGNHVKQSIERAELLNKYGIKLKINTVVTQQNWQEDFHNLIRELKPIRWKIFQVMEIIGQNEKEIKPLLITEKQFEYFISRHSDLYPVSENNDLMKGSYLMIDSLGRFFQNRTGKHHYSSSILEIGVEKAIQEVGWDREKFILRGGKYNWS
jgi:radical S-adenosyl methionine domain-containing protein 2